MGEGEAPWTGKVRLQGGQAAGPVPPVSPGTSVAPGSSPPLLAGQVPSLPPHLYCWGAPGFPKRRPSGGNGNTLRGSLLSVRLPQLDPKAPKPRGKEITTRCSPTPAPFLSPARCLSRSDAAEPRRHFWVEVRRRQLRAPGLRRGKWGRVSQPARGEAPSRPAPARGVGEALS